MGLVSLKPGEYLEPLGQNLSIIQHRQGYRFSLDAVLLAGFVEPKAGEKVFDLGTGSGIIPLLLFLREPEIQVTGLELQERLADQARRSVLLNSLGDRFKIIQGDLKELEGEWLNQWDVVVANPPFFAVKQGGRVNENAGKAIARHEIACTLEDVVKAARLLLKGRGRFLLIHRAERLQTIIEMLACYHFTLTRLAFVHPYEDTPANLVLIEGTLGGGSPLKVLPGVVVHREEGKYTQQLERLFAGENLFC